MIDFEQLEVSKKEANGAGYMSKTERIYMYMGGLVNQRAGD